MILTSAMDKGGTAKTTTAAILAQAAAYQGAKVLAIDLDPQGNLSFCLGASTLPEMGNSYNLFTGLPANKLIQATFQGVDVIPAARDLITIKSDKGSARRLKKALECVKDKYQLIVIDTPATAGELQYNAIYAADLLIIPLQVEAYTLTSLIQTLQAAQTIRADIKAGVLLTRYSGTSTFDKQVKELIEQKAAALNIPYFGRIRNGVAVREAALLQESLFKHAPKSKPAQDYLNAWQSIREYLGIPEPVQKGQKNN